MPHGSAPPAARVEERSPRSLQRWITRLKAVVPACYPNSYRVLFAGPNPDSEMSFPRLSSGLDVADFVELSAPTPWLIEATEQDYFDARRSKASL